ncbi:MAG: NAD(P)/FAD-dependent oxidoreductase [Rhodoferax sp.]|nr:NAD(P)/FAD-dependent oxidoreductase [Rhodoferax sp.]
MGGVERVDCVVIGAGVVGLAVARSLALAGREVIVLESASTIGTGISSRNSEVIHAGIYYPSGSLKASLCVQGKAMLYAYCAERGIGHWRCGKLIVASAPAQQHLLAALVEQAKSNSVDDLRWLTAEQARALEPQLSCHAAILSPSTGIVDSHALMLSLQGDLENAGGMVVLNTPVESMVLTSDATLLIEKDETRLTARAVVNAAGLNAPALASRCQGLDAVHVPRTAWAKGSYFTLTGRAPFSHLIYPVPQAAGLGVHLTLDLGGRARFGPDVQWVDSAQDLEVDAARAPGFYADIRRYWPALPDGALQPGYAGMRPKIHGPGELARDFMIQGPADHGVAGLVNLFGIESPGLTSALAIGQHVRAMLTPDSS